MKLRHSILTLLSILALTFSAATLTSAVDSVRPSTQSAVEDQVGKVFDRLDQRVEQYAKFIVKLEQFRSWASQQQGVDLTAFDQQLRLVKTQHATLKNTVSTANQKLATIDYSAGLASAKQSITSELSPVRTELTQTYNQVSTLVSLAVQIAN